MKFKLLDSILNPTEEHLKELYHLMGPKIIGHVLKNSGTKGEGEELFRETYIAMVKNVKTKKYKDTGKSEAYFMSIAVNLWKMELRRKARKLKNESPLSENEYWIEDEEANFEHKIIRNERLQALRVNLKKLGEKCRELFRMHYELEMSFVDIAQELESKDVTIRKRHFDCKKKLLNFIKNKHTL